MACPNDNQLRSFHLGMLPDPGIEQVHQHLEQCESCSERLEELESESDMVLEAIRQPIIANAKPPEFIGTADPHDPSGAHDPIAAGNPNAGTPSVGTPSNAELIAPQPSDTVSPAHRDRPHPIGGDTAAAQSQPQENNPVQLADAPTCLEANSVIGSNQRNPSSENGARAIAEPTDNHDGSAKRASLSGSNRHEDSNGVSKQPHPAGRLEPGARIGDYELIGEIDAGGMGRIFQARHLHMGRVVAIKFLNNVHATEAIARFKREIETSARLIHANIVTSLDAGQLGNDTLYLVMEHVEGENFAKRVKRLGPMDPADAVDYVTKAAEALSYLHQRHIVHRDVKPHNLMLSNEGDVKLLDMGIVRLMDDMHDATKRDNAAADNNTIRGDGSFPDLVSPIPGAGSPKLSPKLSSKLTDTDRADAALTRATAILGSVSFMAPEQANGDFDHRADIYGLGCTLYFLLAGKPPYQCDSIFELQHSHRNASIPSVREQNKKVSPALDRICQRAMAKEPCDRFQTMDEMHWALQQVAGGGRGVGRWITVLAAAFAFLIAGVVYRIETNTGVLVIESLDKDVEVIVKRNGEQIEIIDTKTNNRVELKSGEYELELANGSMQQLSTDRFELLRGGVAIVKVRRERPLELVTLPFSKEEALDAQERAAKQMRLPRSWKNPGGMEFALIPPGTMSPQADYHQVLTQPYYLGKHEVTRKQFREFVEETNYVTDPERTGKGTLVAPLGRVREDASKGGRGDGYQDWIVPGANWREPGYDQTDSHPVTLVSFRDAKAFAAWRSVKDGVRYRVPTYAEWIWAHCAGASNSQMESGEYRARHGWFSADGFATHPVGEREPNSLGIFDTFGNAFEWTAGGLPKENATGWDVNPVHEENGFQALSRGGCFANPVTSPSFHNYKYATGSGSNAIGFRLLREVDGNSSTPASGILSLAANVDQEVAVDVMLGENRIARLNNAHRYQSLPTGSYELLVTSKPRWSVSKPNITLRSGMVENVDVIPPEVPDYELTVPFDREDAKQAQLSCAAAIDGPVKWENDIGIHFTLIPPGTLRIKDGFKATVTRPYFLGTYETTVAQFRKFVDATGYKTDAERLKNGWIELATSRKPDPNAHWKDPGFKQTPRDPVCLVSWNDAQAFCQWMSKQDGRRYRLPTLAESELARSAGVNAHPMKPVKVNDAYGWFANDAELRTHPVGTQEPNQYGLFDLHGNVSEWVLDCQSPSMQGWLEDPVGKEDTSLRQLAPGGNYKTALQATPMGGAASPTAAFCIFGFRVVCEIPKQTPAGK